MPVGKGFLLLRSEQPSYMPIKFLVAHRVSFLMSLQLCFYYIEESAVSDFDLPVGLRMTQGRKMVSHPEI